MRLPCFLSAAGLVALASGAHAQAPDAAAGDAESMSSVQVRAPLKPLRIRDEQAAWITGRYSLANGWYLKVHSEPRYIVARIDERDPIRLYAVAPYQFVSRDGKVTMDFRRGPAGEDMAMGYVPETGVAWIEVVSLPLALAQR